MVRSTTLSLTLVFVAGLTTSVPAQAPKTSPRISIVQRGATRLLEDTQHMMSLSDEGEEQWETVQEFVEEIFLLGVDRSRPMRIDLVIGDGPTRYVPAFPVEDEDNFLTNLNNFDIDDRKKGKGYYELRDAFEGWLRFKDGYALIAEKDFAGDIPATIADPATAIAAILEKDYDLAAEIVNADVTQEARDTRRETFHKNVFDELVAAVGSRDDESKEEFDLRKLGIEQQLTEFERYYADTATARIGWTADTKKVTGTADILLEAIPESELAAALVLLNKAPNRFANVQRSENAILSLRLNNPLDPLRRKHFEEFYALLRPVLKTRINEKEGLEAGEKQGREKLVDLVIDMLDAGAQAGVAEGFAEIVPNGKSHTGVVGIRSPNGKQADDIVAMLPTANGKIAIKTNAATVGGVTIHEVTLPIEELPGLASLFGESNTILVGTEKEVVWLAAGPDAMTALTNAINDVAKPNEGSAADPFLDLSMRLRPWMDVRSKSAGETGGDPALREIVLESLKNGDDSLSLTLGRDDQNRVNGKLVVKEAVFRLVGRLMAKFSKENLEA